MRRLATPTEIVDLQMSTKETLLRRKDIPDHAVEELIARAAQLQDESQNNADTASAAQIVAVAEELDIEERYVQQAIEEWSQSGDELAADDSRNRIRKRGQKMLKIAALCVVALMLGVPLTGWAIWNTLGPVLFWATAAVGMGVVALLLWLIA